MLETLISFTLFTGVLVESACSKQSSLASRQSPMLLQVRHGRFAQASQVASECQTTAPGEKCYEEIMANDSYIFADPGQKLTPEKCLNVFVDNCGVGF